MPTYREQVLADGAVAYWRLDEASGNALSQVGNFPGTVTGGVTRGQPGALSDGNSAMAFDGATGYIEVADAPGLHFTTVVTMEAWIRLPSLIGASLIVVTKGRGGYAFGYGLVIQTGRVGYRWNNGDYLTTAALTVNEWHHVVVIANESSTPNVTVYVNGVQYAGGFTGATPTGDFISVNNFPLGIGYLWDALSAEHFNGQIDEVAIYPTALTPQQIANHYALKNPPSDPYGQRVISDGAVLYLRLDEPSGTSVTSKVGGYTGTISGGVTLNQPGPLSNGNKAMRLDGVNGMVAVPAGPNLTGGPLSVEAWVNKVADSSDAGIVGTGMSGFAGYHLTWHLNQGIYFYTGGVPTGGAVSSNTGWHHFVGTWDGTTGANGIKVYVDGVQVGQGTATRTTLTETGFEIGTGGSFLNGFVDEVAVYQTALTPQQIADHYALRYGQRTYQEYVIADGAVAYWKLDESSGTVAKSQVGSYDGTISGGVTLGQPGAINGYTAMRFNGGSYPNDRITVPMSTYGNFGTGPLTQEFWFKTTYTGPTTMVNCGTNAGGINVQIELATTTVYVVIQPLGFFPVWAGLPIIGGNWHHLVIVVTRGTTDFITLYLDGVGYVAKPLPSSGSNLTAVDRLTIGSQTDGATSFNGSIDEVAIYQTALTPQQITAHYQARIAWPDPPYAPSVPADVYPAGSLSNRWLPLTPSDVIDAPFGKLWIGGAGTLAAVGADGRVVNFTGIKAGTMLPLAGRRINSSGTTATAILALRTQ